MPSVIQKKSYGSVKTFWLNKELLDKEIKKAIKKVLKERPEVEEAVLFGSVAENKATVASDVDILLIVKNSNKKFIDRALDYVDYFSNIGLNADIFVYTKEEVKIHNPFVDKQLSKGVHFSLDRKA